MSKICITCGAMNSNATTVCARCGTTLVNSINNQNGNIPSYEDRYMKRPEQSTYITGNKIPSTIFHIEHALKEASGNFGRRGFIIGICCAVMLMLSVLWMPAFRMTYREDNETASITVLWNMRMSLSDTRTNMDSSEINEANRDLSIINTIITNNATTIIVVGLAILCFIMVLLKKKFWFIVTSTCTLAFGLSQIYIMESFISASRDSLGASVEREIGYFVFLLSTIGIFAASILAKKGK